MLRKARDLPFGKQHMIVMNFMPIFPKYGNIVPVN